MPELKDRLRSLELIPAPDLREGIRTREPRGPRVEPRRGRVGVILLALAIAGAGIVFAVRAFRGTEQPSRPATTIQNGKIAFAAYSGGHWQIFSVEPDGSERSQLTRLSTDQFHPAWSPDGGRIAFSAQSAEGHAEIYVMDADGSNIEQLTEGAGWSYLPAWSPDASRIVFVSNRDGNDEIYVMDADRSNQERLTDHPGEDLSPAWAPDGTRIAFQSNRGGNNEIFVMSPDGTGVRNLTDAPISGEFDPAWSPDGTRIAFASDRDGDPEIYVMNADGSDVTRLTNDPGHDWNPAWAPDGSGIAFESDRDGATALYTMEIDGTNPVGLTDTGADACCPAWQPAAIKEESPEPSVSPSAPAALTRGAAQFDPEDGIWVLTPLDWSFLVDPSGPDEPKTLFAIANYPIERGGDCAPTMALGVLLADGVLAWVIEYDDTQGNDFPTRPDRFSLDPSSLSNYECSGTHATYMFRFQDQGRYFQVHVALGEQASEAVRDEMLASLSSLVVDQCPPAEPPVLVSEFGSLIPDRGRAGGTVTLSGPTGRDENWFWSPLEKIEVWWSPENIGVPEETRDRLLLASIDPLSSCDFTVTFATPDVPAGRYVITILGYHEDGGFGLMGERLFTVTG